MRAEGTKQLSPTEDDVVLLHTNNTTFGNFAAFNGPEVSRLYVRIDDWQNEILYIGLSAEADDSGVLPTSPPTAASYQFRIVAPNGTVVHGPFTINVGNSNCPTWASAVAGPDPLFPGGYSTAAPFAVFNPSVNGMQNGDYRLEFMDVPPGGVNVKFFDFTVAKSGVEEPGRLWSLNWVLRTPPIAVIPPECGWDRPFNGIFYTYTDEGFVSAINFLNSGFQGLTFIVAFSETGPGTTGNVIEDRKSVDVGTPGQIGDAADHMVFVNEPDPDIFITPPDLCGQVDFLDLMCDTGGYCLLIGVTKPGLIEVLFDFTGMNGEFDPGTQDVLLAELLTEPDTICLYWDGLKGDGSPLSFSEPVPALVRYSQGIQHYSAYDVELLYDGFCTETIRPECFGMSNLLYWDDSNITDDPNTPFVDESDPGTGQPLIQLNGCICQTGGCRTWDNYQLGANPETCEGEPAGFGNERILNTWWYGISQTIGPFDLPILRAQASGDTSVCPGETTVFTVATNPMAMGYTYTWSGPGGFNGNMQSTGPVSQPGFYYITVFDPVTSCEAVDSIEFVVSPAIETMIDFMCLGPNNPNADVDLMVMGGVPPYMFLWSNGAMTEDLFNVDAGTYTVTVTDDNGCTAVDMVTVEDCCNLDVTCPPMNGGIFACVADVPGPDTTLVVINDYCTSVMVSSSDNTNGASGCGSDTLRVTRTYVVSDGEGNSTTCVQIFTVIDNVAPVVVCPANLTVQCDAPTDPGSTGIASAIDNCDGSVITMFTDNVIGGSCPQEMTINRTWTATDNCGNVGSCVQVITVVDTQAPSIMCPPNVTLEVNDPTGPGSTGMPAAIDNCDPMPVIGFSDMISAGNCAQEMTITRTWTATDACGNSTACVQMIFIGDSEPPVITCPPNVTINCDESTAPANTGTATAEDSGDPSPMVTFSDLVIGGQCPQEMQIIRTWTATDNCGNSSSCTQSITVVDQSAPVLTCPPNVTISCEQSSAPASTGSASATDNCDPTPTVGFTDGIIPSTVCPQESVITRTWFATDACGNSTSCAQIITIVDDTAPVINCPANVTVDCDASTDPDDTGMPTVMDNCDGNPMVNFMDNITPGACPQEMTITRTWVVTDACGNSSTCVQTINVVDDEAPQIVPGTCPPDITISCDDEPGGFGEPSFTDNCGMATLQIMEQIIGFVPPSSEGQIIRTFIITDECGNVNSTCVQTITVVDDGMPIVICPPNLTVECGSPTDTSATGVATYSDDCGDAADLILVVTDMNFGFGDDCGDATINRTFQVTDPDGNVASCTQIITIEDTQPPTFQLPANITIECDQDVDDLGITGNVSGVMDCSVVTSITYNDVFVSMGCSGTGEIARTWTLADACGNTSTGVQTIVIEDTTPPIVMAPANITIDCTEDPFDTTTTGSMIVVSDACSTEFEISYMDNLNGLNGCNGTGSIIRTWTASDECGNSATAIQSITIVDNTPPVAMCQDITLNFDGSSVITITPDTVDTGSFDNCGNVFVTLNQVTFDCIQFRDEPTQEFVMTVTDQCGNQSTCLFTITGEGGSGILLECPADVTIHLDPGACEMYYNYNLSAERRCGTEDPVVVQTDNSGYTNGDAFPIGVHDQSYIIYNSLGDTLYCDFTITVVGYEQTNFTMACNDQVNISMDANCEARINPDIILEGDHYGCYNDFFIEVSNGLSGNYSVLLTGDNTVIGQTYTVTITDNKTGYSCWSTIVVEDKLPPIVECADYVIWCNTPLEPVYGAPILEYVPYAPMATDNCADNLVYEYEDEFFEGQCGLDSILRHWVITDGRGNASQCTQRLIVQLATLADIEFPPTYQGTCFGESHPAVTGYPSLGGISLGAIANPYCNIWAWYDDLILDACGNGTKIVRKWTAYDACTETFIKHDQVIKLTDIEAPELTCHPDITIGTDPWYCNADIPLTPPEFYDACGSDITFTPIIPDGAGYLFGSGSNLVWRDVPVGTWVLTWEGEDDCGNVGTCSYLITIVDDKAPAAICDQHTILTLTSNSDVPYGLTKLAAEVLDDGSVDNCGPVTFAVRRMTSCIDFDWTTNGAGIDEIPNGSVTAADRGLNFGPMVPFSCCDVGTTVMVELRVIDQAGNYNSCMVEVEVQDKLAPDVTCPPDIIVSCDYWFDAEETNGFVSQDEDPTSAIFGRVLDANVYDESDRRQIWINDPGNNQVAQPYLWGLDGWAVDNCDLDIEVRVRIFNDCSGDDLPNNGQFPKPPHAVRLIERTFRAADPSGNTSTCRQIIWVVDYKPFYITDTNCNNADPNDGVKWPCDIEMHTCPSGDFSPEALNSMPILNDDNCSTVATTYEDQVFTFVDGACFKILRTWTVIDWCQFDQVTGAGLWEYLQIIKVIDTTPPEFEDCPAEPVTYCVADPNVELPANNQVFLGEGNPGATSCSVHLRLEHLVTEMCSDQMTYDVKVYPFNGTEYLQVVAETEIQIVSDSAMLIFDTKTCAIPELRMSGLPYNGDPCGDDAYHRILWTVEDGCGNLATCQYLFRLEDCKQPSPVCVSTLSTVPMPSSGEVTIWAADFNASSFDDCTPKDELLYSFSGQTYQPGITYNCDSLVANGSPVFLVNVWVADAGYDFNCNGTIEWTERNRDYCTSTIIIMDNENVCDGDSSGIAGMILTEEGEAVENVEIGLTSPGLQYPDFMTHEDGFYYFFSLPQDQDYMIVPERNDDHRNGVSTLDLIYIQRHLLGIQPLTSPFKLIAADANGSGTISATDLLEVRRLILGAINEFTHSPSWRFIPVAYDFADPFAPWPIEEYLELPHLDGMAMHSDFTGVKVGDVNSSVAAHLQNGDIAIRAGRPEVVLEVPERVRPAGGQIRVPVMIDADEIAGLQLTVGIGKLRFTGIEPGILDVKPEHYAISGHQIAMSWNDVDARRLSQEVPAFTLVFEGQSEVDLSEVLSLVEGVSANEIYLEVGGDRDVIGDASFRFNTADEALPQIGEDFALYQNTPNPWTEETRIGYTLPVPMHTVLTIYDATGKRVLIREADAPAGYSEIILTQKDLPQGAVMYYKLDAYTDGVGDETSTYSATKKMVVIK